ncbi:response regulator [Oscillospiraceae bacterium HV4-5-C5C]|nr:response regulator [Oscillospiraceae bacterium HV4-5-C5C]
MEDYQYTCVICDDERSVIQELQQTVDWQQLGIRLAGSCDTGQAALQLMVEEKPSLAILDIRMPGLNGLELMAAARRSGLDTDFIILSGYDDFSYAQEAMHYGAKAYLLKPLNTAELSNELLRICAARSQGGPGHSVNPQFQKQLVLQFLKSLINGKMMESSTLDSLLKTYHLPLADAECHVIVLSYDHLQSDFQPETSRCQQLCQFLNQTCIQPRHLFFCNQPHQIAAILNESGEASVQEAQRIQQLLKGQPEPLPLIGIGDNVPTLLQSAYSYSRALTALTYQLYENPSGIYPYNLICTQAPRLALSDIDYLPLVQFIVKRDLSGIKTYCTDFIRSLFYVTMPPPNYVISSVFALYHLIENEFAAYSHDTLNAVTSPEELYQYRSLNQIQDWLIRSFSHLSEYIDAVYGYGSSNYAEERPVQVRDKLIECSQTFIRQHISQPLKIEDIARSVHLSASYFAIYFKNKTGVNLRDYIMQEKMEYARKRLISPDTVITELSYQLGYRDYRSFSRAFKKIHGMTPSDFQAKYRH